MHLKIKPVIAITILALLVLFITVGMIKKYESGIVTDTPVAEPVKNEPKILLKESPVKLNKKTGFKSNEEIKKEYGKIETVLLWNGRKYTGAVISTDPVYSIVTVEGTVNVPIADVKLREIIR